MTAPEELAQQLLDRFGYIVFHVPHPLPIGHVFHKMATTKREVVLDAKFVVVGTATREEEDEQIDFIGATRQPEDLLNPYFYKAVAE